MQCSLLIEKSELKCFLFICKERLYLFSERGGRAYIRPLFPESTRAVSMAHFCSEIFFSAIVLCEACGKAGYRQELHYISIFQTGEAGSPDVFSVKLKIDTLENLYLKNNFMGEYLPSYCKYVVFGPSIRAFYKEDIAGFTDGGYSVVIVPDSRNKHCSSQREASSKRGKATSDSIEQGFAVGETCGKNFRGASFMGKVMRIDISGGPEIWRVALPFIEYGISEVGYIESLSCSRNLTYSAGLVCGDTIYNVKIDIRTREWTLSTEESFSLPRNVVPSLEIQGSSLTVSASEIASSVLDNSAVRLKSANK